MYRIAARKAHGNETITYRQNMCISDLFEDKKVLSVCIATENTKTYYDSLRQLICALPVIKIDGCVYRVTSLENIETMKRNLNVIRVEFEKIINGHATYSMLYSDEYGYDIKARFAVKI